MSKALHISFLGAEKETKSIQLPNPKADITPQAVKAVADEIVTSQVLLSGAEPVTKFTKAYVREISDTELFNSTDED